MLKNKPCLKRILIPFLTAWWWIEFYFMMKLRLPGPLTLKNQFLNEKNFILFCHSGVLLSRLLVTYSCLKSFMGIVEKMAPLKIPPRDLSWKQFLKCDPGMSWTLGKNVQNASEGTLKDFCEHFVIREMSNWNQIKIHDQTFPCVLLVST